MVATVHDALRYKRMEHCLACGSGLLTTYLDLGHQPLANDYHDGSVELATYPLALNVCEVCHHSQLTHAVDPDLLFRDYSYVSGTTATLSAYFEDFVTEVELDLGPERMSVLDIAGNDGTLLTKFAAHGHDVLNVDPAANLTATSEANGIPTICAYWDADTWQSLDHPYDAIVAMNVLGHVQRPLDFLVGCRKALARGGRVYVQTSQAAMVPECQWDTVYAEHHSFFSARSFIKLAQRAGLVTEHVSNPDVHGGSYLWTLSTDGVPDNSVWNRLDYEVTHGYYLDQTYRDFATNAEKTADFLVQTVELYKEAGYAAIGYGAAAKGMTVLNYAGVDLDWIADDNPRKQGLLTPGRNIPIRATSELADVDAPICLVIPAWNFAHEIRKRVDAVRDTSRDVTVQYFPTPLVQRWQP